VDLICRRIVEEHDVRIRENFDQVLNNKLAGISAFALQFLLYTSFPLFPMYCDLL